MERDADGSLLPVVTLLSPSERARVDAVGQGCFSSIHRERMEDVVEDLKHHRVQALLVSVSYAQHQTPRVASLVREFPRVPAVALLSELESRSPQTILALGHGGIKRLVDVRSASGWRELRGALMADSGMTGQRTALGTLATDLLGVPNDCWLFFETLFTCSPRIGSVRVLSRQLGVLPSTLMSRFFRAGVPTPKQYLAMARLVRAAHLFENVGFSIANVANHLDYSSPQSFGRHLKAVLGITASEFRACYDGNSMFNRFRQDLIMPYLLQLKNLQPINAPRSWMHCVYERRQINQEGAP